MSDVSGQIRGIQQRILEDMKKRRDVLDQGIAKLEYAIDKPNPDYDIDFEAIKEEARKDMEFLEKCERVRKGDG